MNPILIAVFVLAVLTIVLVAVMIVPPILEGITPE